jgi:hypothetical protein
MERQQTIKLKRERKNQLQVINNKMKLAIKHYLNVCTGGKRQDDTSTKGSR